ncbi:hypothetical protein HDU79_010370 [Rhizoclosmatium sp. JEL0117]|nr:hypothetical protein HDU79_010370 [Rhizoclosmatium sp. JEL0117]
MDKNRWTSLFRLNRIADVVLLGFAFLFVFIAFGVTQNMASTVLPSSQVAFPCLGTLYLSFALFNLFGAAPLVDSIGPRPAMFFASLTYTAFDVSNVFAMALSGDIGSQLMVLIPASIFIGAGAAVLWAAQGVYVMRCATKETIGRYSGVFLGIYSVSSFVGPMFTSVLVDLDIPKLDVFKILSGVGAIGPLLFVVTWLRPEPSNPAAEIETVSEPLDKTPLFLKTYKLIISKKMLMVAALAFLGSFGNAFNTGSFPLFIKSGDPTNDLREKLSMQIVYGVSLSTWAFAIGPITDYVKNPALVLIVDGILYLSAILALCLHDNPINNFALLYPVSVIFAINDATVLNTAYKIVGMTFPANTSAYAAYKFWTSIATSICYFLSRAMLGANGTPNMAAWTPFMGSLFFFAVISAYFVTKSSAESGKKLDGIVVEAKKSASIEQVGLLRDKEDEDNFVLEADIEEGVAPAPRMATEAKQERISLFKLNRIWDVIILGFAFFFIFTAFSSLASTVLPSSEVAFPELGTLYFAFALFNLFGAAPLVDRIGTRPAMFFAALTYTLFTFANVGGILLTGNPSHQLALLLPAAGLIGMGAAVLWTAEGAYVIKCSSKETIGRYTGVFFGLLAASNCAGPLFTAALLQTSLSKEDTFKILGGVGSLGPLILIYIWSRPEPSNPDVDLREAKEKEDLDKTPLFLKAGKIIISRPMLQVAVLVYLQAFEQTFSTGSLSLFIKTESTTNDLRTKLLLIATYGASLTLGAFSIGPITDWVNNPTLIIAVDSAIHMSALLALWLHPNPLNNLALLIPVNIICAVSDSTLLNQVYKILAGVFPANASAYAAYKFHASFMTGVCFFLSKLMLGSDGIPVMAIWVPFLGVMFVLAIVSTYYSTRGIVWSQPAKNEVEFDVVELGSGSTVLNAESKVQAVVEVTLSK